MMEEKIAELATPSANIMEGAVVVVLAAFAGFIATDLTKRGVKAAFAAFHNR